jgi:iron complex outermembrane recepter protein
MHQLEIRNSMSERARRRTEIAGLFAAFCLTMPAWAFAQLAYSPSATTQSPSAGGLDEVIVTARRVSENVQDVPISIVDLNSTQLNYQSVTTANDLGRVAPGLSIMNTAANTGAVTYSIRGQGSTFGSGPGVIPYFDEVANFSQAIFDVANVQVLKGPQGTLFGRNTTGGAVLFTPNMPTDTFNGYADVRAGNFGRADVEFGVGGPIIGDTLTFRLSGQSLNRAGYTTDVVTGVKLDNENEQNVRGILKFKLNDSFDNTALVQWTQQSENGNSAPLTTISPQSPLAPLLAPQLAMQQALGIRDVLGEFPYATAFAATYGGIDTANLKINNLLSLKNIASYLHSTTERAWDLDATNLPLLGVLNPTATNEQYTEEFQVRLNDGPLTGVVGYYFEHQSSPFEIGFVEVSSFLFAGVPIPGVNAAVNAEGLTSKSRAPYAQFDYKVLPQLTLTAGVRYTSDDVTATPTGSALISFPPLPALSALPFAFTPGAEHDFHATTWNVAADYAVDPNLNIYGHVSKGYKQGGFNGTAPPALQSYNPEFVIDYELGTKGHSEFANGWKIRYDADAFYDHYTNIQRDENVTLPTGGVATIIQNAAAGYITGAEFQFAIELNKYFQVSTAYTYLYAKYTSFNGGPGVGDVSASKFPNTPTSQFTLTPIVTLPIPEHFGTLTAQGTVYAQSHFATDAFNVPNGNPTVDLDVPGANAPGYTRVDLRIQWNHIMSSQVSAGLYALNVLDRRYITGTDNQLNSFGIRSAVFAPPPLYGIEVRYEFGH